MSKQSVAVRSGSLTLHAFLWRPPGRGSFRAVLFNHGSGRSPEALKRLGPYERNAEALGPVFARHGYVFLYLFRRGVGPSGSQGANAEDVMNKALAAGGQEARNSVQMQLLENRDISDARAGLAFLRSLPEVDRGRIALIGHSFGGSLTLLLAEHERNVGAVVVFAAAGLSWDRSPLFQKRLVTANSEITAPVFFLYAANDYSVSAGKALDAERRATGTPHRLKIYPPVGRTQEEGHDFVYLDVGSWEADVFAFLNEYL